MKRLALVLLLLLASPASARTWWVSPVGSAGANGNDSTTNATTLARVNADATAGDVVRFKSGAYSTEINPTHNGTATDRIRFYGFPQDPGAVRVNDITFGASQWNCSSRGSYCTARWFTTTSGLTANPDCQDMHPVGDSLVRIVGNGMSGGNVLWFRGENCLLDSLTCTGTITGTGQNRFIEGFVGGHAPVHMVVRDSVKNSTFNLTVNAPGVVSDVDVIGLSHDSLCVFQNNTFNVTITSCQGYFFISTLYQSFGNQFNGNTFNVVVNGTPGGTKGGFTHRDYSTFNRYVGNTVRITGAGEMQMLFTTAGSDQHTSTNNYYGNNTIFVANPQSGVGAVNYGDGMYSDTLEFNVIAAGDGSPALKNFNNNASFDVQGGIVRHNTFYSTGPTAVDLSLGTNVTGNRFASNIYYGGSANGAGSETVRLPASGIGLDSAGVFYSSGGTDTRGLSKGGVASAPPGGASLYANPLFVNSAYATLNTNLQDGSPAISGTSVWDGFAGAYGTATVATSWTITVTQGANGTIAPGTSIVADGGSQAFTFAPAANYHLASVTVDGASVAVSSPYTFTNVTEDHTITATFAIDTYPIFSSAGFGGTISPDGTTSVNAGGSQAYSFTPSGGKVLFDVSVDDMSVGTTSPYTFTNVLAPHTIQAFYTDEPAGADSFTVLSTAGAGGSISPSGYTRIASGGSQEYTVTAFTGYYIADITVDDVSVGDTSPYTLSNVTDDHTIEASFYADSISIVSTAGAHGRISPAGATPFAAGASRSYIILADPFYAIADVLVDDVSVGPVTSYTFTNVVTSHTIEAQFTDEARHGGSSWRRRHR